MKTRIIAVHLRVDEVNWQIMNSIRETENLTWYGVICKYLTADIPKTEDELRVIEKRNDIKIFRKKLA